MSIVTKVRSVEVPAIIDQMYPNTADEKETCERFFAKQKGVSQDVIDDMRMALGLIPTPEPEKFCEACGTKMSRRIGNDAGFSCNRCKRQRRKR